MKENDFIICLLIVSILLLVSILIPEPGCETCSMYNEKHNTTLVGMNGIAFGDGYYCIWTENRTNEEIANTEVHEKCHILINKDKEHFCKRELICQ